MRWARVALAAGLTLTATALAAVLWHSPAAVARTNGIAAEDPLSHFSDRASVCQADEVLPHGTLAIVVSLSAFHGPRLAARVFANAHAVTGGRAGSNWSGRTVTVPVRPLTRTIDHATVCFAFSTSHEPVSPYGQPAPPGLEATGNGAALPGRLMVEYLRPGGRSWLSLAASIVDRMGFGRAAGGAWVALVAIALMIAVAAVASRALLRELR